MDLAQLTMSRRTVHNFTGEKISDQWVENALRLSLWAPNHKLTFPWAYFWVGDKLRTDLADLSVRLKETKGPLSEVKKGAVRDSVMRPSHLILMATKLGDPGRVHEDYATRACSVKIATLVLWEQNIGTKWSTGQFSTHAETYALLGISPQEYGLQGVLMIGVPAIMPPPPPRPALAQVLRRTT